jgi:hypothetical protein
LTLAIATDRYLAHGARIYFAKHADARRALLAQPYFMDGKQIPARPITNPALAKSSRLSISNLDYGTPLSSIVTELNELVANSVNYITRCMKSLCASLIPVELISQHRMTMDQSSSIVATLLVQRSYCILLYRATREKDPVSRSDPGKFKLDSFH